MLPPGALTHLATQPMELGDLATWISAAANVATVILATAAALVGYRVYKVESGRDARAEQDRRDRDVEARRSQAALVSAWYGLSAESTRTVEGWLSASPGAWIVNASDSPIYDARITFNALRHGKNRAWFSDLIKVVPPYRGELYVDVGIEAREWLTDEVRKTIEVSLHFRDAAGRYWHRDMRGYLREVTHY